MLKRFVERQGLRLLAIRIGVSPSWFEKVSPDFISYMQQIIVLLGREGAQLHFRKSAVGLDAMDEKTAIQRLLSLQDSGDGRDDARKSQKAPEHANKTSRA